MLESCWVNTHTLMPAWRAEKPSLTSSPVRPFTSFEAAQSSSTMRVFVPSKAKLATFSHISTWCCSQMMTNSRGSLAKPVQSLVKGEGWADQNNVIELAFEWPAKLVHEKLSLARVGRANDQRVEWNIGRVHFNTAHRYLVSVYFEC